MRLFGAALAVEARKTAAARVTVATSVFLAVGQIIGSVIGGAAADLWAFDGILVATLVLMGIALVPLAQLRRWLPICILRLCRRAACTISSPSCGLWLHGFST